MPQPRFVHLHNHTLYSLLDGALRIPEVLDNAAKSKMPAMAITDHGNMFGIVPFFEEAMKRGVKPIIGCEVYMAPTSRFDRSSGEASRYYHTVLLAENEKGYRNLVKLVSAGYLEGFYYKPRIDKEILASHAEGLIGLSACLKGEVLQKLADYDDEGAANAALEYEDILGKGNFYLEIQDHGLEEQKRFNPALVEVSKKTGIPLVATNDCHYLKQEDSFAHDVLLAIQTGKTLNDPNRLRYRSDQFYFKSPKEMLAVFSELPEALNTTVEIADRCHFTLETGKMFLPRFQVPEGTGMEEYFRKVVEEGFEERLKHLKVRQDRGLLRHELGDYRQRLEEEMEMVVRMKFPGYFLIVWDFIRYARQKGIPVGPGRGSAAGSLIAYCLEITDIDPLQYNLLFERFLNPERVSMPDIDIDFCQNRRSEVIEYVTEKYGRDNVAQIITFDTLLARAAIRDVGRVMEIPYAEVDQISKMIPSEAKITLDEAVKSNPKLKDTIDKDNRYGELFKAARRLEGLNRHASVHAAGVVIAPNPITEYMPLYRSGKDEVTTQFPMKDVEKLGLLKMDFLGLKTLTVLHDATAMIEETTGEKIDFREIPLDDKETYKLFSNGSTACIFQFESSGMRDILRRLQPRRFSDLIALNALYRPGAIKGGMIDVYIQRRRGKEKGEAVLPEIQDILEETHGVIVYQEQVMQIARKLAGFSLGEADLLRRAMGKKVQKEMKAQRDKFLAGAKKNKIPDKKAREVFELMAHFAEYGFNKSHSAAYALLAYQTAYLKVHYPVQYMASVLTHEMENSDKMVKYIHECKEMGIDVLPPDINESDKHFTVVGKKKIRFGLGAIKQVGQGAVDSVLAARSRLGHFSSVFQFCQEVDLRAVNKRVVENLVKSGTMDAFGLRRSQLMDVIDKAIEAAQRAQRDRQTGQSSLFGDEVLDGALQVQMVPDVEDWKEHDKLAYEKETLGFYITGHPLTRFEEELKAHATANTAGIAENGSSGTIRIGGIVARARTSRTKGGNLMCTFDLEDLHGIAEVKVFPKTYENCERQIKAGRAVLVEGRIEENEQSRTLIASSVEPLEELREKIIKEVEINLSIPALDEPTLRRIRKIVESHPGQRPIVLRLFRPRSFSVLIRPGNSLRVNPTRKAVEDLEKAAGEGTVRCLY